jgi:hypothetical protein
MTFRTFWDNSENVVKEVFDRTTPLRTSLLVPRVENITGHDRIDL